MATTSIKVAVTPLIAAAADRLPVEVVERKGMRHPDTICDALAEELEASRCRNTTSSVAGLILLQRRQGIAGWAGRRAPVFGGGGEVLQSDRIVSRRGAPPQRSRYPDPAGGNRGRVGARLGSQAQPARARCRAACAHSLPAAPQFRRAGRPVHAPARERRGAGQRIRPAASATRRSMRSRPWCCASNAT